MDWDEPPPRRVNLDLIELVHFESGSREHSDMELTLKLAASVFMWNPSRGWGYLYQHFGCIGTAGI